MRRFASPLCAALLSGFTFWAGSALAQVPSGFELVFADEFSGTQLDTTKWITTMHFAGSKGGRYHNVSYLNYNLDENILFDNGVLHLKADRQTITGTDPAGVYQYTGALISSDGKFDFKYGYIEMRAKYPGGRGVWPVFWLLPKERMKWPPEFDIAEYYAGSSVMHMGLCHGSVHDPQWDSFGDTESGAEDGYRTYALEWSPGRAVWYLDGAIKKVVEKSYVPDMPMYIILNNGVSSHIGPSGQPNDKTVFPNSFEIDYVRVYQSKSDVPANSPAMELTKGTTPAAPTIPAVVPPVSPAASLPLGELLLK
jgi:beta-glucanase (GH16 family)